MITNSITLSGVLSMMAVDNYPYTTFRVLGAFHVILGLLFIIEGAVTTGLVAAYALIDFNPLKLPPPWDWSLEWTYRISPIPFGIMVSHNLRWCRCERQKIKINFPPCFSGKRPKFFLIKKKFCRSHMHHRNSLLKQRSRFL